jgi:hypothetical protein
MWGLGLAWDLEMARMIGAMGTGLICLMGSSLGPGAQGDD